MKRSLWLILFMACNYCLLAQNNIVTDSKIEKEILYGHINPSAFQLDICTNWYNPEFNSYPINKKVLKKLKKQDFNAISIELIFGSWCHDSQREVPRFLKLLKEINFPLKQVSMYALNTQKFALDYDAKNHNIRRVPTFIVYYNNKEIGRIIETPKKRLEKDLLTILLKN